MSYFVPAILDDIRGVLAGLVDLADKLRQAFIRVRDLFAEVGRFQNN